MKNPIRKLWPKRRRYPIEYDENGRSIRQVCFEEFDAGKRPMEVIKTYGFKRSTVFKYWQQWKKTSPGFHKRYEFAKTVRKKAPDFIDLSIKAAAMRYDLSELEVLNRLEKAWGLQRMMKGSWENDPSDPFREEATRKMTKIWAIVLINEMNGTPPEKIIEELQGIGVEFRDSPPMADPESQKILDEVDAVCEQAGLADGKIPDAG